MICPECYHSLAWAYVIVTSKGTTYECRLNNLTELFYAVDEQFIDDIDAVKIVCWCGYEVVATPESSRERIG